MSSLFVIVALVVVWLVSGFFGHRCVAAGWRMEFGDLSPKAPRALVLFCYFGGPAALLSFYCIYLKTRSRYLVGDTVEKRIGRLHRSITER